MGRELREMKSGYYERIGVSFELPNLYSKFTAQENLSFFRSLYSGETEEPKKLLSIVELSGDANTRVSRFSKGMKMQLNFCMAFLNKPEIIFLDEPTSGLDPVNAKRIKDIIMEKKIEGIWEKPTGEATRNVKNLFKLPVFFIVFMKRNRVVHNSPQSFKTIFRNSWIEKSGLL